MDELIQSVKDWPVIIQGALGSALFWLFLKAADAMLSSANKTYSSFSKKAKRNWIRSEIGKVQAVLAKEQHQASPWLTILIYRCLRDIVRALMWLCLGLLGQSLVPGAGIIGFIGCIHYLFRAYHSVAPVQKDENSEERLQDLREELKKLKV
ncbi:TPA: hypothetical protein ACN976_004043 [Vibrio campbellii]